MKLARAAIGLAAAGVLAWFAVPGLSARFMGAKSRAIPDASFLYQEDSLPQRASKLTPDDVDADVTYLLAALDRA